MCAILSSRSIRYVVIQWPSVSSPLRLFLSPQGEWSGVPFFTELKPHGQGMIIFLEGWGYAAESKVLYLEIVSCRYLNVMDFDTNASDPYCDIFCNGKNVQTSVKYANLNPNFHEHFELGPLLRYVDTLPGQTEEARARLRSTSRRVISRQLAPLLSSVAATKGRSPAFQEISLNSDGTEPADKLLSCAVPETDANTAPVSVSGTITLNCSSTALGAPLRIVSPDGKDSLQLNVRAVSWAAQTVGIYALLLGADGETQAHTPPIEFTLSPYSFPFSDNTLLPSGNRFGIYLTRLDDIPGVARIMRLSFVWFPKQFVPPRERPFDLDVHELKPDPALSP